MGSNIRSITLTETFHEEDTVKLSEQDLKDAHQLHKDLGLQARDPAAYFAMMAKRNQAVIAQSIAQNSQFANASGAGQAPTNVTPTPLGTAITHNYHNPYNYPEAWRLASRAGPNGIQTKRYAEHSNIPGAAESGQIIGSSSVLPTQSQSNMVVPNTISTVDSASTSGDAIFDLQPMEDPLNVSKGQLPDLTAVQPNSPAVRTDNIALVNARIGEQNSNSEEPGRANTKDLNVRADSTVISVPKNTAKEQNAATPNRTGTPTSGIPPKPTPSSKTTFGRLARNTPGMPSRSSSSGPVPSKHPATALITADAPRVLRSNSYAGSLNAPESKQKQSTTPSARACSTSFHSGFHALNDAFLSGSNSHHTRPQAK